MELHRVRHLQALASGAAPVLIWDRDWAALETETQRRDYLVKALKKELPAFAP